MKEKVNILFLCGYGVGSSLMAKMVVEKALKKYNFSFEMVHTAAGESTGYANWVDIVVISRKLVDAVDLNSFKGKAIIEIDNLMDGEGISAQIFEIVKNNYKEVIKG